MAILCLLHLVFILHHGWCNGALYTPNRAGVQLDTPPGIHDAAPGSPSSSQNTEPVEPPRSPNSGSAFSPRADETESHRSPSPSHRGRDRTLAEPQPEFKPYVSEGYIDAKPKPQLNNEPTLSGRYHDEPPSRDYDEPEPSTFGGNKPEPRVGQQGSGVGSFRGRPSGPPRSHVAPSYLPITNNQNEKSYAPPQASHGPSYQADHPPPPQQSAYPSQGVHQAPLDLNPRPNQYQPQSQQSPANQYNPPRDTFQDGSYIPKQQFLSPKDQSPIKSATPHESTQPKGFVAPPAGNQFSSFPAPFDFPGNLKVDNKFPFPKAISFDSPRPFKTRAPLTFPEKDSITSPFTNQIQPAKAQETKPHTREPLKPQQPTYPRSQPASYPTDNPHLPQQPGPYPHVQGDPRYPTSSRYPGVGGNPAYFGYGNAPAGRSQCFQYVYPAEAYRLSDIAKSYPGDAIKKELGQKPYLAPLVGHEAQEEKRSDPFSSFSQFDYVNFGFRERESSADKYGYLLNSKAYPGAYKEGDFAGGYPVSMRPQDTSCPSIPYKLRSFFYHGGDCYVVNPEHQVVTYHRCSRRECNFCGVNRGLSACVENYRWFTVFAYCSKLKDGSRILPLQLILPVGCSCQHFPC